ncbi:putative reverse transcriptase domain-containing protein [Tanacetum coccineum]
MGGGDDGGDDDGDSSGDDADDEDEDMEKEEEDEEEEDEDEEEEEEEEEEEHIASADSTAVIPIVEVVSSLRGQRLLYHHLPPPPPHAITTTGARISVRLQASVSLPSTADVERLLALPTPPLSPLTSLSPPSAEGRDSHPLWPSLMAVTSRITITFIYTIIRLAELHELGTQRTNNASRVDALGWMTLQRQLWTVVEEAYDVSSDGNHSIDSAPASEYSHSDTAPEALRPCQRYESGDGRHADRVCYPSGEQLRERETAGPGTEAWFGLHDWIEKMESVFNISGCAVENQVKFATCTLMDAALTWWNSLIRSLGPDAYNMTWVVLKKKMTDKYCPLGEVQKLEIELWNLKVKGNDVPAYTNRFQELALICTKFVSLPKTLDETIELANELMDQKLRTYAERQSDSKRKADDISRNNQQPFKKQNVAKAYNLGTAEKKTYEGGIYAHDCKSASNTNATNNRGSNGPNPKGNGCFECGNLRHFKRDYLKLKNKNGGNGNAQGWVYAVGKAEENRNCCGGGNRNRTSSRVVPLNNVSMHLYCLVKGADRSFMSTAFSSDCQSSQLRLPSSSITVNFRIDLIPGAAPVARAPYRLAPSERRDLSEQHPQRRSDKTGRPPKTPTEIAILGLAGIPVIIEGFTKFVEVNDDSLHQKEVSSTGAMKEVEMHFQLIKQKLCSAQFWLVS